MYVHDLIDRAGGLVTTSQLTAVMSRKMLSTHVRTGDIVRVCHGVYARTPPDIMGTLAALDLMVGQPLVACMGTAAWLYGFDTERDGRVHVLDPAVRLRPTTGVMVHQRAGAPLRRVQGRLTTAPAWTAVEVARTLRRPRALATLDAALHVGACTVAELEAAVHAEGAARDRRSARDVVVRGRSRRVADGK